MCSYESLSRQWGHSRPRTPRHLCRRVYQSATSRAGFPAIERIMHAYGLNQYIEAQDTADMLDRFVARLKKLFKPRSFLVETPFETINFCGQRTSGFIDLLLETDKGLVIIDRKSFLGASADWSD